MNAKEELIQRAITWVENTEEFLVRETPIFVEELMSYHLIRNIASFGIFTVILVGLMLIMTWAIKKAKAGHFDDEDLIMSAILFPAAIGLFIFIGMMIKGFAIIKILIAPRLFLIEQLSGMM